MIWVDERYLEHLALVLDEQNEIIRGKYDKTPGQRQHIINIIELSRKQLNLQMN